MEPACAFSYITVSAPEFTSTVLPGMLIVAPWPLEMVMPMSLTEIIAPLAVWIRMPPPGASLMTRPFVRVVCSVMPLTPGRHVARQRRRLAVAPVAADPDRVVGVAALELDPHARADRRHREHAHVDAGHRQARQRPARGRSCRRRRRPTPGCGRSAADRCCCRPCRGTCRRNGPRLIPAPSATVEISALRASEKLCLYAPRLISCVTLFT